MLKVVLEFLELPTGLLIYYYLYEHIDAFPTLNPIHRDCIFLCLSCSIKSSSVLQIYAALYLKIILKAPMINLPDQSVGAFLRPHELLLLAPFRRAVP